MQRPDRLMTASICVDSDGSTCVKVLDSYIPIDKDFVRRQIQYKIEECEGRLSFYKAMERTLTNRVNEHGACWYRGSYKLST